MKLLIELAAFLSLLGLGYILVARTVEFIQHRMMLPLSIESRLYRAMVGHGLTGSRGELPQLRRRQRGADTLTLWWKMPLGTAKKLEAAADELAVHLGVAIQVRIDRDLVQTRLGTSEMPEYVAMTDERILSGGRGALPIHLGESAEGPLDFDLAGFPHGVVAGTTGGGKTSLILAWVVQLAFRLPPAAVRFVVVDLKGGQGTVQIEHLPHLLWPIACRHEAAAVVLSDLVREMERRQEEAKARGCKDIGAWNKAFPDERQGRIVVVIDEYADLLPAEAPKGSEEQQAREVCWAAVSALTRLGRSAGIHVIIGTQRPDAKVVSGQVRTNCPVHVAFAMDGYGSTTILGLGNMAAAQLPVNADGRPRAGAAILQWNALEIVFQAAHMPDEMLDGLVETIRQRYSGPAMPPPARPNRRALEES